VRESKLWALALASLVLAAGVVVGCGDDDEDEGPAGGEASFDLVIGDLIPLTGDLADFGPPGRKAADLALEEINKATQEVGAEHNVEIVHEDDQTDAQAGVSAARKLVTADKAACIAGSWASDVSIPVARSVTSREQVLQISPASTSDDITALEDNGFMNRTPPPDKFQGPALADVIEEEVGGAQGKTVNIGARNDAYGTNLTETFSEAWEGKGGQIGERVIYDPEQPSYDSEADQITSGNPDAIVIIDFPETYNKVGPALVRTGNFDTEKTFVTDGLFSSDLPGSAGRRATEGIRGSFPGSPDAGAAAEAFDEIYKAAGGPPRQAFDAQNFDAVILCYLSAVAAGEANGQAMAEQVRGVSGPPGDKFTWQQLPDAIRALQDGNDIDYEGASGPIDMNEDGDPTAGVYDLFEFRGGKPEIYDEVQLQIEQ
jgi:ABC-type branched-subunit amino acid transport system substrate-binding protein